MLVQEARAAGSAAGFMTTSFAGDDLIKELGQDSNGVIMAQAVPRLSRLINPLVRDYARHLKLALPQATPSYPGLEAYIAARALVEGLKLAGKNLTRKSFIAAMESMKRLDLGDIELSFSPDNHNGSNYVDITIISRGKFMN